MPAVVHVGAAPAAANSAPDKLRIWSFMSLAGPKSLLGQFEIGHEEHPVYIDAVGCLRL
jgi:hypothetical protein